MEIELDDFLEKNIICNQCLNIPLLGIEFVYKSKSISEIIKLHSFCLFHKNKNRVNEFLLNNIYKEKAKVKKANSIKINCEFCKKKQNEYLCLDCKRNICKECSKYHKSHKLYQNNQYLISKDDFDKIINNFKSAKNNLNKNLSYITNKINCFKAQLQNLENLYKEYKDLNDKLISLTQFIIDKYQNKEKSGKSIYYPIYFNIKNILEFNFHELKIKDDNVLSIKSFTNCLLDRIKSGLFFLLSDSKYNRNLYDYTNEKLIKINTLKIEEFKEIKVDYSKFIFLEDKTKIVGIENGSNILEIYNIQNESVETRIELDTSVSYYNNIILDENMILLVTDLKIYIINPKTFSIIQKIKLNHNITDEVHQFIYGDIISKDSIGIIYWGDLRCLDNFSFTENLINLPSNQYYFGDIINYKHEYFEGFENKSHKYIYFLLYKKDNKGNFILNKVILLVKKDIGLNEVDFVSYKHFEVEDDEPYCSFYFESLNRFSDKEYVIAFNSQIKADRDQYNYYITDKNYSNRTIYYYLNIDDNIIKEEISYSKEKSFLHRINTTFYFLFTKSEKCSNNLKEYLKAYQFIGIKMDELDFRDFYYQNGTILGWNKDQIYFGEIYSNKLEMIQNIHKFKSNGYKISFICFNPNIIIYGSSINSININNISEDNSSENDFIDE